MCRLPIGIPNGSTERRKTRGYPSQAHQLDGGAGQPGHATLETEKNWFMQEIEVRRVQYLIFYGKFESITIFFNNISLSFNN